MKSSAAEEHRRWQQKRNLCGLDQDHLVLVPETYLGPLVARQEQISAALLLARSGSVPQKLHLHLADQTGLEPDLLQFTTNTPIQTPSRENTTPLVGSTCSRPVSGELHVCMCLLLSDSCAEAASAWRWDTWKCWA